MRAFVLLTCLVVGVLARPDVGYTYKGLQQSRRQQQNGLNVKPLVHQQLPAEHSFGNFGGLGSPFSAPTAEAPAAPAEQNAAPEESAPSQAPQQDSYNSAFQHSTNSQDGGYPYGPQETSIHKHIYVHVPPKDFEDEDVIETHVRHQAAPKQRHYKIVFIKAPAPPSIRPPVVPPPPQNEEKTLIYVLHKRPDAAKDIVIPSAAPTKPTKPEVYFIKYKTRKEQAPVYGPPPQPKVEVEPRNAEPAAEYGAPAGADDFAQVDTADLSAPITTLEPAAEAEEPQQFTSDLPAGEPFDPTNGVDQAQPTVPAPSNQYLAPDQHSSSAAAPIVVEEPSHVPATNYGPPSRFFLKKKK